MDELLKQIAALKEKADADTRIIGELLDARRADAHEVKNWQAKYLNEFSLSRMYKARAEMFERKYKELLEKTSST